MSNLTDTSLEPLTAESRPDSMRKHMTRAFDEVLGADPAVVYVGEDVEHGG
jgi:hypothetical protein